MTANSHDEARRLLAAGLKLVPLKAGSKQPLGDDWNSPARLLTRPEQVRADHGGFGMPLAVNGMCSVDFDNNPLAEAGLRACGFDPATIRAAGVATSSTRPGSGGRVTFRIPAGLNLGRVVFASASGGTILELRAGQSNLQDCLPGTTYYSKDGSGPWVQDYADPFLTFDTALELPAALAAWWSRLCADLDFKRQQQALVAGPDAHLSVSSGATLAYPSPHRQAFNQSHAVEDLLREHGYTEHRGGRWSCPTATGAPGIHEIPGKSGLWQSAHGSDPLEGTFDAWTAFVVLVHGGDQGAAETAAEAARQSTCLEGFEEVPGTVETAPATLPPPGFRRVAIADVLTHPEAPHPFVWEPYIPAGAAVTLLAGHGGSGKSGLGLDLAMHVAAGREFLGFPVQKTPVVYLSAEDSAGVLRRRLARLCEAHDLDPVDLDRHLTVLDATECPVLWDPQPHGPGKPSQAYGKLRAVIEETSAGLLVVDNASDAFAADRFDKTSATQFVRALARLMSQSQGAVLLLAHVNKATAGKQQDAGESFSDSVAWHNSVRSRLFLEIGDGMVRTLQHAKSNYGPLGPTLPLEPLPHGVGLALLGGVPPAVDRAAQADAARDAERLALLSCIAQACERGLDVSTAPTSNASNAFGMLRFEPGFPSIDRATTLRHVSTLAARGLIARETYTKANRHPGERWSLTPAGLALLAAQTTPLF
ncbi:AAA family ATPase [Ideonella sp. B508-1]|uniref:AAA family ATPase n=1 Tax=Ideonella sp. B508-1 TaxID=137716 RepID=UPI0003B54076|nr:AAA family ATPase [Ideonella sp. B508-1]